MVLNDTQNTQDQLKRDKQGNTRLGLILKKYFKIKRESLKYRVNAIYTGWEVSAYILNGNIGSGRYTGGGTKKSPPGIYPGGGGLEGGLFAKAL